MHDMDGMGPLPPFGWHAMAGTWALHPGWILAGLVLLVGYLAAARAAGAHGARVHPARIASWVAGVVVLELTLASAIDAYAMAVFWVHMVEHLILIMVVPALLVCGRPLGTVADALRGEAREHYLAVLRSGPVSVLTHPLVGMIVYGGVIVATHLTGFMDAMAMNPWLMTAEQVLYVVAGGWMLLTLIGSEPIRWQVPYLFRIGLLLVGMVPDTVVGIVLMQTETDPFPAMMAMHPAWAPDPVRDVQIGGALMWAAGDGLMMCFGVGVVLAMISGVTRREQVLGPWLESVRRNTLAEHVASSGAEPAAEDDDPDSEAALAAYNRMLGRLNQHG